MKKTLSILCIATMAATTVNAQGKKTTANTPQSSPKEEAFKTTPNGIEYRIVNDVAGTNTPKIGDYIYAHLLSKVNDSVLFSTRSVLNNQPAEVQIQQVPGRGDIIEGFMYMTPGDSAIFRISVDTLIKLGMQPFPWMKPGTGQKVVYYALLTDVKTAEEKKKAAEAAAEQQKSIDDNLLKDYFVKNNITATRTASGLYYKIDKPGTGANPGMGDTVVVNYTGKTMDGKTFDSNMDPAFMHVQPFEFPLGMHRVIAGWDEGIALLKKGATGTLYVPSGLAYGANSPNPTTKPANAKLIFDVELAGIKKMGDKTPKQVIQPKMSPSKPADKKKN